MLRPHRFALAALLAATLAAGSVRAEGTPVAEPPLGLLAAYLRTLDHSPAARAANASYAAAILAEPAARSQLFPELNAVVRYDRIRQGVEGDYFGLAELNTATIHNRPALVVRVDQPLFRRELFVQLDQAQALTHRADAQLLNAQHELQIQVALAYFGLLSARDATAAARAERQAIAEQLQQVRARFESGLLADYEVKATRAQNDFAVANEIQAVQEMDLARTRLERLIGGALPVVRELSADARLPEAQFRTVDAWIEQALSRNLRLIAQGLTAQLARLEVDREDAAHWPKLDLVGTHYYYDAEGGFSGAREYSDSRIGAVLSVPVFNGFGTSTRVKAAAQRHQEALELENIAREEVSENVRREFLGLGASQLRVEALRQAVASAESALSAVRTGFEVGTRTSADVLDAIRNRTRARRDLQLARHDYLLGWLRLRRSAGMLSSADFERLDLLLTPKD